MTPKQAAFVNEYLVDFNATQAAIRAGYSERSAYNIGYCNLRHPEVAVALEARLHSLAIDPAAAGVGEPDPPTAAAGASEAVSTGLDGVASEGTTGAPSPEGTLSQTWVLSQLVAIVDRCMREVPVRPASVTYEPLAEATFDPDVVLLRLSGRQLMVLMDAVPGLRVEGKPQCHIVAIAKEQGEIAASVGCQLSGVRTGMTNAEMTCAVPGGEVESLLTRLEATTGADQAVAAYAAEDARRFPAVQ